MRSHRVGAVFEAAKLPFVEAKELHSLQQKATMGGLRRQSMKNPGWAQWLAAAVALAAAATDTLRQAACHAAHQLLPWLLRPELASPRRKKPDLPWREVTIMYRLPLICLALSLVPHLLAAKAAWAGPFPDKNLETAVRATLFDKRDPNTELTDDDLRKVFVLEARGKQIRDLTGLEKCTNLALLNLAQNEVADVNAIKNLANLQSLDLSQNKITDAAPLANLKALQYLELSNNQIAAIPSLEALSRLSALYLDGNKLADLAPLAKLTKLSSLYLAKNQVGNLAPLAELKGLEILKLSDNQVQDLSVIGNFKQLKMLFLERNKIQDLAPLVASAKADAEGEKRFAPYLRLFLADNPLSDAAKNEQLAALKNCGVRLQ